MSSEALNLKELGNKALKEKNYKKAQDCYEKAILLDPTETKFFFNSAITHFHLKNFKACLETCQKAVKVGRENGASSDLLAKCFANLCFHYSWFSTLKSDILPSKSRFLFLWESKSN